MKHLIWWIIAIALFVGGCAPAHAQTLDRVTYTATWSYLALSQVDRLQTTECLAARACVEQNPLLRGIVERRGVVPAMAVAAGLSTASAMAILRMRKHHPKLAFMVAMSALALQSYVTYANHRELHQGGHR